MLGAKHGNIEIIMINFASLLCMFFVHVYPHLFQTSMQLPKLIVSHAVWSLRSFTISKTTDCVPTAHTSQKSPRHHDFRTFLSMMILLTHFQSLTQKLEDGSDRMRIHLHRYWFILSLSCQDPDINSIDID